MVEKNVLSKDAEKLLDGFTASRERWFGNSKDYKTWESVRKVLWHGDLIYSGNGDDNFFISYLEYLAEFSVKRSESVSLRWLKEYCSKQHKIKMGDCKMKQDKMGNIIICPGDKFAIVSIKDLLLAASQEALKK